MASALEGYPVTLEVPVAWGDMDAFQHVNNVMYFKYFESARIAYFEKLGDGSAANAGGVGPILASTSCRYKAPLTYPDDLTVGARVSEVAEDRFTMEYAVFSRRLGRVAAVGDGVVVAYDYGAQRKASLPESWRAVIGELEGR